MRTTQIQLSTQPTAGQIVGAYQSLVATGCLKIAKSKQPEEFLGKFRRALVFSPSAHLSDAKGR